MSQTKNKCKGRKLFIPHPVYLSGSTRLQFEAVCYSSQWKGQNINMQINKRFIAGQQKKGHGENVESHMCTMRDIWSSHLQLGMGLLWRCAVRRFDFPSRFEARRKKNKLKMGETLPSTGNKKQIRGHGWNLRRRNTDEHKQYAQVRRYTRQGTGRSAYYCNVTAGCRHHQS
jgi:hypothetical protein